MKNNIIVVAVLLVCAVIVFGGLQKSGLILRGTLGANALSATPSSGPITVQGKMVCLPHRNQGDVQTMECAFGLSDKAGRYFALHDPDPQNQTISGFPTGSTVEVMGTFTPETSIQYQTIGRIDISSITLIKGAPVK